MTDRRTCPDCGNTLPPEGHCPRCMLGLGLESGGEVPEPDEPSEPGESGPLSPNGPYRILR